MIRLAAESSPVDLAWDAFDAAAIRLNRMYVDAASRDTAADRAARIAASQEAARLWETWRALFLTETGPAPFLSPLPGQPAAVSSADGAGAAALSGE